MEKQAEWPARGRVAVSPFPGDIVRSFRVHSSWSTYRLEQTFQAEDELLSFPEWVLRFVNLSNLFVTFACSASFYIYNRKLGSALCCCRRTTQRFPIRTVAQLLLFQNFVTFINCVKLYYGYEYKYYSYGIICTRFQE